MSKPFILYIFTSGIGENLLAVPVMHKLANTHNVVAVTDEKCKTIFEYYKFLHAIEVIPNMNEYMYNGNEKKCADDINKIISKYDIKFWWCHHEDIVSIFKKHLSIGLLEHPKSNPCTVRLSYIESYAQRIGMSIFELEKYFIAPTEYAPDGKQRIVMFYGSREMLRRMPQKTYEILVNKVYENFHEDYHIVSLQDISQKFNIPNEVEIVNDLIIEDILNLFSKKVNIMVGPNGGMSVIGHLYRTPMIMLESRVRTVTVVPHFLLKMMIPYEMTEEINCLKNCEARSETRLYGKKIIPYHHVRITQRTEYFELECRNEIECPCLNYKEKDISNIIELLKNNLGTKFCSRINK